MPLNTMRSLLGIFGHGICVVLQAMYRLCVMIFAFNEILASVKLNSFGFMKQLLADILCRLTVCCFNTYLIYVFMLQFFYVTFHDVILNCIAFSVQSSFRFCVICLVSSLINNEE